MLDNHLTQPLQLYFNGDGRTPNSRWPVLLYRAVPLQHSDKAVAFEALFTEHDWPARWRSQVYEYQHYHSTAHEVLGVISGRALLLLGGESGSRVEVGAGDVLVLPAGTGHRSLEQSADFLVVGAYPKGQDHYDLLQPGEADYQASVARIAQVTLPAADPVHGADGPLRRAWGVEPAEPKAEDY